MAVLPRRYLNCVLYVYPDRKAAEEGDPTGGTGFMAARRIGQDDQVFLISNRHVIEPMTEPYIRVNKLAGGSEAIRVQKGWWKDHPDGDDISAAQVNLPPYVYEVAWVYEGAFVTQSTIQSYNIGLGDQVVMLGRLPTHDGKIRNMPSARFGHISILPSEPVENKFGHLQETFVAEYYSIAGYSGSPVFVYFPVDTIAETALENAFGRWLLGINWMHFDTPEDVKSRDDNPTEVGAYINTHTGMSGVIPAWRIASLMATFGSPGSIQHS
jgi:hypothetical protein